MCLSVVVEEALEEMMRKQTKTVEKKSSLKNIVSTTGRPMASSQSMIWSRRKAGFMSGSAALASDSPDQRRSNQRQAGMMPPTRMTRAR